MPRPAIEDNQRLSLRMTPDVKARIARAAALRHADLTNFVTQAALREADAIIDRAEHIRLAEDSYNHLLALLEDPPAPNAKLLSAAKALPKLA